MKNNILTIMILALVLINTILTAVLIFTIVPAANKTNQLVTKVAQIVDLELESPESGDIKFSDIVPYNIEGKQTITLKNSADGSVHYAVIEGVSLAMDSSNEDYVALAEKMGEYDNAIKEIISDEFGKYTVNEVSDNMENIKASILVRLNEFFQSDFVITISIGNKIFS